jgi:hypothetical protein
MINKGLEGNVWGDFKDNYEQMFHYNIVIKNQTEQNRVLPIKFNMAQTKVRLDQSIKSINGRK